VLILSCNLIGWNFPKHILHALVLDSPSNYTRWSPFIQLTNSTFLWI
jgi:hypothetical protein